MARMTAKISAKISGAESQIMQALWANGPMGAEEIVREVGEAQSWGEATVKTLINRLLKKKAIASEREAGRARYRPLLTREDYVTGESQGLLDRRPLSPEELERLKALISELERDDG
jgi:BlaI family penicillinase repressor